MMYSIALHNISKFFFDGEQQTKILKNLYLEISSGDFLTITGTSGSGKTTLLKIIVLLESYNNGSYFLEGNKIQYNHNHKLADYRYKLFGYVPQDCGMIDKMSTFDNIAIPLYFRNSLDTTIKNKVYDIAEKLNITSLLYKDVNKLSLGERQRVAIARALVKRPTYFIADEPTSSLDANNKNSFIDLLSELHKNGVTIILVTHDDTISNIGKRNLNMNNGVLSEI